MKTRKKRQEAKSPFFYCVLAINSILLVLLITLQLTLCLIPIPQDNDVTGAVISANAALIGFLITIFALYFTYNMPERLKDILKEDGFYTQIPKDMIRAISFFVASLVLALLIYFTADILRTVLIIISIMQFLAGLSMLIFVISRVFKIIKIN